MYLNKSLYNVDFKFIFDIIIVVIEMAKRGKYDLVLVSENGNEMEYIVKDFNLNDIDALCSAYKSEVDYLISLSQKGIDIKNGHFVIYDYKGFKY